MDLTFLKKHTRAHKYRDQLSTAEITKILERHLPSLGSIQIFNFRDSRFPEIQDDYQEQEARVIQEASRDLQKEFRKKIKVPKGSASEAGLVYYLRSLIFNVGSE